MPPTKKCAGCGKKITTYPCVFCKAKSAADANRSEVSPAFSVIVIGSFILFGAWCATSVSDGGDSSRQQASHDATSAFTMCKQFAGDRLRAPSTADWPCCSDDFTTHLGDGRYRVQTYVDAQNAFGAQIRTDVMCEVRWVSGDRWRLDNLVTE